MSNESTIKQLKEKIESLEKRLSLAEAFNKETDNKNQFLQALLDTIPSPIFYKDKNGVYHNCNDTFSEMILGIPKEKIINKSLFDLPEVIPPELAAVYHEKDQVLFDNPGSQIYQGSVKCADGEIRLFCFYKATVLSENNEVIGLAGVMLDITELEQKKLELSEINKQLETFSFTDPLTGLLNRRKLDSIFSESIKLAKRHQNTLCFAMIDVDNFKLFNDTYGHFEGDNALKLIANSLKESLLRPDDYVFRLGGEEFGLLYYANDAAAALEFSDNIRRGIQDLGIKHTNNNDFNVVTISLGLVIIENDVSDISFIYEGADKLLYQAKKEGRNKILSKVL